MRNSILYYPTIEFRKEDYMWLWNTSLFADKIYRIVPPGHELHEPRNIEALCSSGDIGIPLSPVPYSKEASQDFSDFVSKHKAAAFDLIEKVDTDYIRIHSSKMDVKMIQKVFYQMKHIDEDENWLYARPNAANFYMTFLANHIAKQNALDLWTRNPEVWTTSTFFLFNGDVQDMYYGPNTTEPSTDVLTSIMIPDVFPQNILDIPPESILKFREERRDERAQFMNSINHLRDELSKATAPEIINDIIHDEKGKVNAAVTDYKKSMDLLNVVKFGGVLTTVLTIAADAMGYCNNIPSEYTTAMASAGLWIDILTGLKEQQIKSNDNPYTYLAHMKFSFSFFPDSSKYFAQLPILSKYNYTLSRGIEEFICD